MAFSEKQQEVLKFGFTDYETLICDGAVRSGKSSAMTIAFILWAMDKFNHTNFIVASQTVSSAVRNIINPLFKVKYMTQNFDMRFLKGNNLLVVARGSVVNYFYMFGGSTSISQNPVQGITAGGAFLDEVALMPESFVNQVLARCSEEGAKFWFSCNPEYPTHWFKKGWIDRATERNALYLHFTMEDNPSLSEKVKERYRRMYNGVFYDRYIRGLWTRAEGLIYKALADNREAFILDEVPKDIVMIEAGIDFGGTVSKTSFVAVGYTARMQKVVVLESVRIEKDLTPVLLDEEFVKFSRMVYEKYGLAYNTRCDNAEPVLMNGLKNAVFASKLRTSVKKAQKSLIKNRIDLVVRLQGEERFFFMRWAETAINAFATATWDAKKTDTRLDDGSTDIDTIDATEYAIEGNTKFLMDAKFLRQN